MYYAQRGTLPAKPFTVLRAPSGDPAHEEMFTSSGFSGPASLLYHLRAATVVDRIEVVTELSVDEWEGSALRNHQVDVARLEREGSLAIARTPLFFNEDLTYSLCTPTEVDETFYRNAYNDELLLVVSGTGRIGTAFGALNYAPLDFVYVPRGVTVRLEEISGPQLMIVMETSSPISPPPRYLNSRGQLSYKGLYQERDLRIPRFEGPTDVLGQHPINVKARGRLVRHTLGAHPFDVIGWDGFLYPFALNMRSLAPMSGRLHTTPDIYEVFESNGVYITAITPLRQPDHEESTAAQPDHTSDCDEIFHRLGRPNDDGFEPGMVTLHTRAAAHGAAPALKTRPRRERTTGWGLLIDTVRPTNMARAASAGDVSNYHGGGM